MIVIDGSYGEGGGQIVRTTLALAAITGKAVRLTKMRANRRPPGLRPQHLAAVRAIGDLCRARLPDLEPGISELTFEPEAVAPGTYRWDIGTAGSTCLVLQTVVLPLSLAPGPSRVEIIGGTHNPMAPCFEYLNGVWRYWLERLGVSLQLECDLAGFYPKGGGRIVAHIPGGLRREDILPLQLSERGKLKSLSGVSAAANLPEHVVRRQAAAAMERLRQLGLPAQIGCRDLQSIGVGTVCFLLAEFDRSTAGFFSLGARGKRAERVGREAAEATGTFCTDQTGAAVDRHAADQLIVPLALADGVSSYSTPELTKHARTNAAVTSQMTGRDVYLDGRIGEPGNIQIR